MESPTKTFHKYSFFFVEVRFTFFLDEFSQGTLQKLNAVSKVYNGVSSVELTVLPSSGIYKQHN